MGGSHCRVIVMCCMDILSDKRIHAQSKLQSAEPQSCPALKGLVCVSASSKGT